MERESLSFGKKLEWMEILVTLLQETLGGLATCMAYGR